MDKGNSPGKRVFWPLFRVQLNSLISEFWEKKRHCIFPASMISSSCFLKFWSPVIWGQLVQCPSGGHMSSHWYDYGVQLKVQIKSSKKWSVSQETGGRSQTYKKIFWQVKQDGECEQTVQTVTKQNFSLLSRADAPQESHRPGPDSWICLFGLFWTASSILLLRWWNKYIFLNNYKANEFMWCGS